MAAGYHSGEKALVQPFTDTASGDAKLKVLQRKRQPVTAGSYHASDHRPASCRLEQARLEIMVSDVFISYSSQNTLIADALKHHLEATGIRCFKAPDNILPGQVWEEAIAEAIINSRAMILVWSSQSQVSDQVKRELTLAVNSSKIIIPYKIDNVEPTGTFAYYLTNTHWLDAMNLDAKDAMASLAAKLRVLLDIPITNSATHSTDLESAPVTAPISKITKTTQSHESESGADSLYKELEGFVDQFNDADDWLFKAYQHFENDLSATRKALSNHGLNDHDIEAIHLFLNIGHFRSKNGILICDYVMSVKDFWEKPVHFEFWSAGGGLLEVEAKVDSGTKIVLAVKRSRAGKDGQVISDLVRTFELNNLDNRFLLNFNKKLVEEVLPKLVRTLGLIQRQHNSKNDNV